MKKIILFSIIFIGFSLFTVHCSLFTAEAAVTPTPTSKLTPTSDPSPTTDTSTLDQQLNDLKERIASRVAQLKLVEKRGILGNVTDINQTQITITDIQGQTRYIDVDELTQFASPSAKKGFGISDITKGTFIGVLGLYNKDSKRLLARFVTVQNPQQVVSGAIASIDTKNYTITVTTLDNKNVVFDIDTVTKINAYTQNTLARSGFSKLVQGERVMVVGLPEISGTNLTALRVIRLPGITINPKIVLFKPDQLQVTPSTGSGVKLTPLKK